LKNSLFRIKKTHINQATRVLARAFQDDPLFTYFFPSPQKRERKLPITFRMMVLHGTIYGEVYASSPRMEGIAIWIPSEKMFMTSLPLLRSGGLHTMLKISPREMKRISSYTTFSANLHHRVAPFKHMYLEFIGISPEYQGKGFATHLLTSMLERLDSENLPCFLETQNARNVPVYAHFGFQVIEEGEVPGTGIYHWSMVRRKEK
jgi:GNAT superfamily N-acetyltransferase